MRKPQWPKSAEAGAGSDVSFRDRLDALRCHETSWLRARRAELIAEQRRLHVEELAMLRVLDEHDTLSRFPDAACRRRSRRPSGRARGLESLPAVAERPRGVS